ncbi:hypothetical protein [Sanguibacter suaedae]|uniref:Uncharacterized protein n=1 Tax=Sanguibacter suaedae TaxID=2795737 RepID=A0A934I4D8_9MICO|nr:hypothetical protein [Sanguibacter suaedae]MBI9114016.1 hypothetical protein [Sanguibacter suaedae]
MATYIARITVRDDLDDDTVAGMADALQAQGDPEVLPDRVVFTVPGEAPDGTTASVAASQHAGEVLDGFVWDVDVVETWA